MAKRRHAIEEWNSDKIAHEIKRLAGITPQLLSSNSGDDLKQLEIWGGS